MSTTITMTVTIILYLVGMVYIGVRCSKKNKSTDDFYLGGRKLGPIVTAMSAEASDMSSWLLLGIPGVVLLNGVAGNTTGFAEAFWTVLGLAIGTYLNWLFVAKRIRRYSEKTGSVTLPDFFSNRFHDKKGILCIISAVIIIIFFVPYTGSGFAAVGKLLNSQFGIDYHLALIIGASIIVLYTTLGGFLAASTTDLIQSVIMSVALIVVVVFGINNANAEGFIGVSESISKIPDYFGLFGTDGKSYGIIPIISTLAWGLGYFGMPHILLRFMAIKDDSKLKVSRRIGSVWVVISMGVAMGIGVIGYTFAVNHNLINEGFDSERIIIYMAKEIAGFNVIAAVIGGLILSGILASTMSTADSQLLAAASSVSENLVKRFVWKNISSKAQMWLARISVIVISIIGVVLAWDPDSSVFRIVSFAWAGFGGAFGALVILSLFWKRTNLPGAVAGIVFGGVTIFVWKFVVRPIGGVWDIYELLPAFVVSAVAIVVVSLLTKKPDDAVIEEFESVKNSMKTK